MPDSTLNQSLSSAVHLYRKSKRLSAEECAKELGVSKTQLLNIERGQANPTLETINIIAQNMGTDPLTILGESPTSQLSTALGLANLLDEGYRFSLDTLQQAANLIQSALNILAADLLRPEDDVP